MSCQFLGRKKLSDRQKSASPTFCLRAYLTFGGGGVSASIIGSLLSNLRN